MRSFFNKIVLCCSGTDQCAGCPSRKASLIVPNTLPLERKRRSVEEQVELNAPTVIVVDIDSWDSDDNEGSDTKTLVETESVIRECKDNNLSESYVTVAAGTVPITKRAPFPSSNKTYPYPKLDMMEYTFSGTLEPTKKPSIKIPRLAPVSICVSSPSGTNTDYIPHESGEENTVVSPPVLQHVESGVSGRVVARLNGKRARVGGAWKKRKLKRTDLKSNAVLDES